MLDSRSLLSIFLALICSFLLLEIFLNFQSNKNQFLELNSKFGWTYKAEIEGMNNYGFRDEEWSDRTKNFYLLGDEKTAAVHIAKEKYSPYILQEKLKLNVLNLSVENWNLDNMFLALNNFNNLYPIDYILFALTRHALSYRIDNNALDKIEEKSLTFPFNKSKVLNLLLENSKELLIDKYRKHSDQLSVLDRRIRELNIDRKNFFLLFFPISKATVLMKLEFINF